MADRSVYQHKRSNSSGVGPFGEGSPYASQIEEGEIVINTATRQIYTKRNEYSWGTPRAITDTSISARTGAFVQFLEYVDGPIGSASITVGSTTTPPRAGHDSEGEYKNVFNTSAIANHVIHGYDTYVYTSAVSYDSDLLRRVVIGQEDLYEVTLNSVPPLGEFEAGDRVQVTYVRDSEIRVAADAVVAHITSTTVYLRSFFGNVDGTIVRNGGYSLRVVNDSMLDSESVIRLNNIPYYTPTSTMPPGHLTHHGDMWIQASQTPGAAGNIYWLDRSLENDTAAQDAAAAMSDAERTDRNIVLINGKYAEWRPLASTSRLSTSTENATEFTGQITFDSNTTLNTYDSTINFDSETQINVINGSDINIDGVGSTLNIQNGAELTIDGTSSLTIAQGGIFSMVDSDGTAYNFDRVRKFTIKDAADTIVFGMYGLDDDGIVGN